jgi:hypothetical protein
MVQDTTGSATGTPEIAPDLYASRRGKLSHAQERAIIRLGNVGMPVATADAAFIVEGRTLLALERRGYAFITPRGHKPQVWALTTSGCEQYRRLSGITR